MAHKVYENIVLSNKVNDILTTQVNLNNYMTIDNSLAAEAGMKKVINVYNSVGSIEELGMGEGNSTSLEVSFTPVEYEVKTYQGKFAFYDEQEMQDPMVADVGLTNQTKDMVNEFVAKAIAEYEKAPELKASAWSFDTVVDAIAKMNLEDESGLFLLISPADQAAFRKALKDQLSYSEGFVRTGYIGSVCGVPVIVTKAVADGNKGYLATKEAVTAFIKKDTETEYERDADTRNNTYWIRKVAVVALTDATKAVKITIGA